MAPDTTPLRRQSRTKSRRTPLSPIETTDPKKHYQINSNGIYGNHQYTDLALLLKKKPINQ